MDNNNQHVQPFKTSASNQVPLDEAQIKRNLINKIYLELEDKVLKSSVFTAGFIPGRLQSNMNEANFKISKIGRASCRERV